MTHDSLHATCAVEAELAGRRVLVVGWESSRAVGLDDLFAVTGALVRSVRSVREAVGCYESFAPDVVVARDARRAVLLADGFEAMLGKRVRAMVLVNENDTSASPLPEAC